MLTHKIIECRNVNICFNRNSWLLSREFKWHCTISRCKNGFVSALQRSWQCSSVLSLNWAKLVPRRGLRPSSCCSISKHLSTSILQRLLKLAPIRCKLNFGNAKINIIHWLTQFQRTKSWKINKSVLNKNMPHSIL